MLSYNHGRFIKEALDSILINKSASYDLEVIIIDDGSTDDSISIIEKFNDKEVIPLKLVQKTHGGVNAIAGNFNELVALAQGDYITFLASDDSFTSNRFISQIDEFQKNKDVVLCYGDGVNKENDIILNSIMSKAAKNIMKSQSSQLALDYVTENIPTLFIQTVLIKSSFAKSLSLFDETLIADDWVFNIRVFAEIVKMDFKFAFVNEILFYRNIHDTNTSRNSEVHYLRIKQVVIKYCKPEFRNKILYNSIFLSFMNLIKLKKCLAAFKFLFKETDGFKGYFGVVSESIKFIIKKLF
jgi:glycosyltransferase involved in cell wall biosynthesis